MFKVFIVDPNGGLLVSREEWAKAQDPKAAKYVALKYDNGDTLVISKNHSEKEMDWPTAMKWAESFKEDGVAFRAPTRKEAIDMADAKDYGIMEALELIGGNALESGWYWTCEKVSAWLAARYSGAYAWFYYGGSGYILSYHFYISFTVVPVALYPAEHSEA